MLSEKHCWMYYLLADSTICREYEQLKTLPKIEREDFDLQQCIICVKPGEHLKQVFAWRVGKFKWFTSSGLKLTCAIGYGAETGHYVQAVYIPQAELKRAEASAKEDLATIVVDCFVKRNDSGQLHEEAITAPGPMPYDLNEELKIDKYRDYHADTGCIYSSATLGHWFDPAIYEQDRTQTQQPRTVEHLRLVDRLMEPNTQSRPTRKWHVIDYRHFYNLNSLNGDSLMFIHTNITREQLVDLKLDDWTLAGQSTDKAEELATLPQSGMDVADCEAATEDETEGTDDSTDDSTEDEIDESSSEESDDSDDNDWEPSRSTRRRSVRSGQPVVTSSQHHDEPNEQAHAAQINATPAPDVNQHAVIETAEPPSTGADKKRKRTASSPNEDKRVAAKIEDVERKPKIKSPSPVVEKPGTRAAPLEINDSAPANPSPLAPARRLTNTSGTGAAVPTPPPTRATSMVAAAVTPTPQDDAARERQKRLARRNFHIMRMELAEAKAKRKYEKEFGEPPE
ncbi:hypothetical protein B0A48_14197 [Cryoendolithus antarcticus]|uniref:Uncharacterized protein n=1 Tax=Cryoendolithus antarcticus TaxID=1507870 RepID=A0A1V8SLH9_9PEZI|nr:hypothetical protein B0A48_14197 [Cryoendolithus antarcticus]